MKPIILAAHTDAFARKVYGALDEVTRTRLRLWSKPIAEPGSVEELIRNECAVVVVGPGVVDDVALRFADQIGEERRDVAVVLVHNGAAPVEGAADSHVAVTLSRDADGAGVRTALDAALAAAERAEADPRRTEQPAPSVGRVTTILSPKGGAGKTVLSTNLAVGLAAVAPRGVVIVDLDLQFGDVAYALGLKPRHTIHDALSASGELDITTLKVFLSHHESDLYALCAPDDPARGEMVPVDIVHQIVTLLAGEFDHVVVDTGAGLSEHALVALDVSTDVVFLADMDVPSVRHLSKVIRAFDRLGMTQAARHFVLNRADARVGLSMMKVATQAGLSIDLELPQSKQIPVSLNTGVPIITSAPRNPFSRIVEELVTRIAGHEVREITPPMRWSA
jgi:pilus assembly protein CpaE